MMKLYAAVMFIIFLLPERGICKLQPNLVERNESQRIIYWHFHQHSTIGESKQICEEYGMTLSSINRSSKGGFLQRLYEKIVNFLDSKSETINVDAFICEKHFVSKSDYFHGVANGSMCAQQWYSIGGNQFQCAFYCNINEKCSYFCMFSNHCILYVKSSKTCAKKIFQNQKCFSKVYI